MKYVILIIVLTILCPAMADEAGVFFDDSRVREIHLSIDFSDWYRTLLDSHAGNPEDPYFPASFSSNDITLSNIGIRFKGNSSFRVNSIKKSLKLHFAEFDEDLQFMGLKKLNLNNCYKDPTMLRAKLFLDFARQYVPTIRAVHTRVYINSEFWGLYLAVEQIDKTFVQSRFGDDEDGNLYKAETSSEAKADDGIGSDMTWMGSAPGAYHMAYQLKTNETDYDYTDLIEVVDILNNTAAQDLPAALEPVFDVESALLSMALNILFVNLDSYCSTAHNYYLYDRDDTGKILHLHWDTNEAFGRFLRNVAPGTNPLHLEPFWLPTASTSSSKPNNRGAPVPEFKARPLMENLWALDTYQKTYLRALASMRREGFDADTMSQRIIELADLIRPSVYEDKNKMYSNTDFEKNFTDYVGQRGNGAYGLLEFVDERCRYLDPILDSYADHSDIRLNEIMISNAQTTVDQAGDYDGWLELYNIGPGRVNLSGLYLSDDMNELAKWSLPDMILNDGRCLVLWLDAETHENETHTSFIPQSTGGSLYLSTLDAIIDQVTYAPLESDQSLGRTRDGLGDWDVMDTPTPAVANLWTYNPPELYINEFMAVNKTTLEDPDEEGTFDDWIEIYNAELLDVDLSGMVITDNPNDPPEWTIPAGVIIPAQGYLLFWADNDLEQGVMHTNFKLDSSGDVVALYDTEAHGHAFIDRIAFDEQTEDASCGRVPDGGQWTILSTPTPGTANISSNDQ